MGSDKSKKKTALDWVVILVILIAVSVGGYFLYQKVIKHMIWPESAPTGNFRVITPPGGKPMLVPITSGTPSTLSTDSFGDQFGASGGLEI